MRNAGIVIAVALLCGCSASGHEAAAPPPPPPALVPCVLDGIPDAAECTTITVRESSTGSRTIDLRVVIVPARSATPRPDPIVPLGGGPGQGAAEIGAALAQRFSALRDDRALVLIDQRGTGASNGLQCPAPVDPRNLMGRIFDPGELATCRAQLSGRADLTRYTTTDAARDYAEVFDRLGYDTVNLIGNSYGTRMALEIARQHPRRVRSMVIDGVVPMDFTWPTSGAPDHEAALTALIDMCEADAACAAAFPRFRQDVDVAFARVRQPLQADVRDPSTGAMARVTFGSSDLAYATRGILYGNDALSLPLWYRRAAEGDFTAFAQAYVSRARALDAQIASGVHFGVYCSEDLPFVDRARAEQAAAGTRFGTFLLDQYRQVCETWPRAEASAAFRAPVESTVPTLLMSGARDPVTPPRTASEASRTLARSTAIVWPRGGHGNDALLSGECRASILRAFIATADPAALPLECVTRDAVRPFVLQ